MMKVNLIAGTATVRGGASTEQCELVGPVVTRLALHSAGQADAVR
jgi:hypothetical protein